MCYTLNILNLCPLFLVCLGCLLHLVLFFLISLAYQGLSYKLEARLALYFVDYIKVVIMVEIETSNKIHPPQKVFVDLLLFVFDMVTVIRVVLETLFTRHFKWVPFKRGGFQLYNLFYVRSYPYEWFSRHFEKQMIGKWDGHVPEHKRLKFDQNIIHLMVKGKISTVYLEIWSN